MALGERAILAPAEGATAPGPGGAQVSFNSKARIA